MQTMGQFLVVSAIGPNRTGIINQVASHVAQCGCNIVDSRLAILGSEFTLMMLLTGSWNAMAQVEATLPLKSHELDLLSVMKRTSEPEVQVYAYGASISIEIQDEPGTIHNFTRFFSENNASLHSLQSEIYKEEPSNTEILHANFQFSLPKGCDISTIEQRFYQLCAELETQSHTIVIHPLSP